MRKGYTTGSCVIVAAKVTTLMVMCQHLVHQVSIATPSGVTPYLDVKPPHIEGQQTVTTIRKDDGDDADVTHGTLVFARVTLSDNGEINLQGGEGIGTVTHKRIGLPTGSPAISRTP